MRELSNRTSGRGFWSGARCSRRRVRSCHRPRGRPAICTGPVRQHRRQRLGRAGCGQSRRDRHDQQGHGPHQETVDQRGRRLHARRTSCPAVRRQGLAAGLPGVRQDRRAGHRRADQPRRGGARGRRADRDGDGRLGGAAAADRQGGPPHRAQGEGDHQSAAATSTGTIRR